ncbi:MAG: coenzyme F420-0:L-glutamate ligase [Patescibacteria group bacterium]
MQILAIKTPIFKENENLINFLHKQINSLNDNDIIVITSKIIALSQGRTGKIKDKEKLIKKNSQKIIETPWALLTLTEGEWCINAGIDESNAKNNVILLPKNPFKVAEQIQKNLLKHFSLKHIGVIITDTKSIPLRVGTVGRPIAYIGFNPLRSYIGKKDLFGRKSRLTQSNIADALATSAVLVMGEGIEQIPIVIIKNAPIEFTNKKTFKKTSLALSPKTDIYSKIFTYSEQKSHKPSSENHHGL